MVVVDNLLEHCREIDLYELLCWSTISHATSHSPYDAAEDSVALAAPYDLMCAVSVTHRSDVWLLLSVDCLFVVWNMTSVWFADSHTRLTLMAALPSIRGS